MKKIKAYTYEIINQEDCIKSITNVFIQAHNQTGYNFTNKLPKIIGMYKNHKDIKDLKYWVLSWVEGDIKTMKLDFYTKESYNKYIVNAYKNNF